MAKLLEKRQADIEAEVGLAFLLLITDTALNGILLLNFSLCFFFLFKRKKEECTNSHKDFIA